MLAAATVAERSRLARAEHPALIVLDVMLPDGDGFVRGGKLRELSPRADPLPHRARSPDVDKLTGFGVGGDDYVTKPFNPLEVVARVKAHLRRAAQRARPTDAPGAGPRVRRVPCCIEDEGRLVVDGSDVAIAGARVQLLAFLCANRGRVFSKRQLYRQVWGEEPMGEADDNTVQVHVRRLREKIEADPGDPRYLADGARPRLQARVARDGERDALRPARSPHRSLPRPRGRSC